MTDTPPGGKPNTSKWLWILILIVFLILVIIWFRNPLGKVDQSPATQGAPQPVATLTPAPEESGVPITLPTAQLAPGTDAPTSSAGSSSGAGD